MDKVKIEGGAFQVARKIFDSEIWLKKPTIWKVIWIYILGKVSHAPYKEFDKAEGFFNFSKEMKLIDIECTPDKIKKFLKYARQNQMISTTRSTRGVTIKVLNYNTYQDLNNYTSTTESTTDSILEHQRSTTIYKNYKNYNNKNKEINNKEIFKNQKNGKQKTEFSDIWNDTFPE